jgi:cell division transport system permease protein
VRHLGYFTGEALRALRLHAVANLVSVACVTLALLTLSFFLGAWWNLEHLLEVARAESQIVVYLYEGTTEEDAIALAGSLAEGPGVHGTRVVTGEESLSRIQAMLGSGIDMAGILEGYNPFPPSVEVSVLPERAREIAAFARNLRGVDAVRDNEEILQPLARLTRAIRWIGTVASLAVVTAVLALVSHMVRLGIAARRQDMETLRLMGASEWFLAAPFLLEGVAIGALGGLLSLAAVAILWPGAYGLVGSSLPFLPLLDWAEVFWRLGPLLLCLGLASGLLGSVISLKSA